MRYVARTYSTIVGITASRYASLFRALSALDKSNGLVASSVRSTRCVARQAVHVVSGGQFKSSSVRAVRDLPCRAIHCGKQRITRVFLRRWIGTLWTSTACRVCKCVLWRSVLAACSLQACNAGSRLLQEMPVTSSICEPLDGTVLPSDSTEVTVKGFAWSGGGRGITRVDVSIDGGQTWHVADVTAQPDDPSPSNSRSWGWTLWRADIAIPPTIRAAAAASSLTERPVLKIVVSECFLQSRTFLHVCILSFTLHVFPR